MAMVSSAFPKSPTSVSQETMEKAVSALLKWSESKSKYQKPQLLDEDQLFYLILTLKKIPQKGSANPRKIPLPHPLHSPSSSEVCLIIDDRPTSDLTSAAAKNKVKSESVPVTKVLKLSKLRSDYREFEKKRKLCDSYDLFLADNRVIPVLPTLLGKQFFRKKKIPVPVALTHKHWKEQFERVLGSALLFLGTGTCSVLKVGRASMEKEEVVENVAAVIGAVADFLPKKWTNVRSIHLKLAESPALPLYQALPDARLKIAGIESVKQIESSEGKSNSSNDDTGKGKASKKKKGRIHEIRYMDDNNGELLDGDELDMSDEGEGEASFEVKKLDKKRKKEGVVDKIMSAEKKLKKMKKIKKADGAKEKQVSPSLENGEESGRKKEKKNKARKATEGEKNVKGKKRMKKQALD